MPPKKSPSANAGGSADDEAPERDVGEQPVNSKARQPKIKTIRIIAGQLSRLVDEAERALIDSGLPIFARGGALMYPVRELVPASGGRTTITAGLKVATLDLVLRWLAEAATFVRYDARSKKWVTVDAPRQLAATLLAGQDRWQFPRIAGVVTTPLLRPDGSLLSDPGYDEATQLFMAPDPDLDLLDLSEQPTRTEATAALRLLTGLLDGFEFKSEVDRAVALSLLLTLVARGSLPTAPLHLIRATGAGTGKSFLVDVAAVIATGRTCPVTTAGRTPEESEKKLGAMLRGGMPIIALDNCTYDLEGDMLCQIAERPLISIRILGVSEVVEFDCRAAVVATGNNIGPKGDMNRRTLTCNLVADIERPELRDFAFDPLARVLTDRGAYLSAIFTIVRAYAAAGAPTVCKPLGSYARWTAMVRAPLIWLGEADPVESMEMTREEDPELTAIRELFAQWQQHLPEGSLTALQIAETAGAVDLDRKPVHTEFRDLLLRVAGDKGNISTKRLGVWLRRIQGKVVGGLRMASLSGRAGGHAPRFYLKADAAQMAQQAGAYETDTFSRGGW